LFWKILIPAAPKRRTGVLPNSAACSYPRFRLIDRNLTPRCIAFCETAPRVRRSFFATSGPESFAFARARRFFTSSFDHGRITLRVFFAIITPYMKSGHCTDAAHKSQKKSSPGLCSLVSLAMAGSQTPIAPATSAPMDGFASACSPIGFKAFLITASPAAQIVSGSK